MKHTEYIIPIGEDAQDYDEMFIGVIRRQPELVRCKDCTWYYRGGATCMFWDGANSMCGDDYCSRAEVKEE
ncbi:MAG: hypothetical protein IKD59_04230 [Lachnospiraceae bacterium]|nr:hypothetical protein [Lachnospiraceae bacterium]